MKKGPCGPFLLTTEITWSVLVPWALSTALRAAFSRYPPGAFRSPRLPTTSPFLRSGSGPVTMCYSAVCYPPTLRAVQSR